MPLPGPEPLDPDVLAFVKALAQADARRDMKREAAQRRESTAAK